MALGVLQALDSATVEDPDRIFADICSVADELQSIARSIRENAYRRNGAWLRIHRVEFIRRSRLLSSLIRELDGGAQ